MNSLIESIKQLRLILLFHFGRYYGFLFIAICVWPLLIKAVESYGWGVEAFDSSYTQNVFLGFPIYCVAILSGVILVAGELEGNTFEINYTIPVGVGSTLFSKLLSVLALIAAIDFFLWFFLILLFGKLELFLLYSVFQASCFFLVLSVWLAARVRSLLLATIMAGLCLLVLLNYTAHWWNPVFNPRLNLESGSGESMYDVFKSYFLNFIYVLILYSMTVLRIEQREVMLK